VGLGAAALIATAASALVLRLLPAIGRPVELALTLLAAYVAYEVVLFAFTPVLGGAGALSRATRPSISLAGSRVGIAAPLSGRPSLWRSLLVAHRPGGGRWCGAQRRSG
jgi:hypothetical protein